MAEPITGSIEVEAPVAQVYEYWRNLENLPSFMKNIEEVRATGPDTTHWVVKGPLGYRAEFDARTTQDEPNSAIGWNTVDGDVQTSGQVRFQEITPNRTRLEVQMKYADPPGGKARRGGLQAHLRPEDHHGAGPQELQRPHGGQGDARGDPAASRRGRRAQRRHRDADLRHGPRGRRRPGAALAPASPGRRLLRQQGQVPHHIRVLGSSQLSAFSCRRGRPVRQRRGSMGIQLQRPAHRQCPCQHSQWPGRRGHHHSGRGHRPAQWRAG